MATLVATFLALDGIFHQAGLNGEEAVVWVEGSDETATATLSCFISVVCDTQKS